MKPFKFHPDAEVELYAQRDFYENLTTKSLFGPLHIPSVSPATGVNG